MGDRQNGRAAGTKYLFTPGPVPVKPEVALSEAQPMISHRGADFHALFSGIQTKLGALLRSQGPVVVLPSSGTGALEALAANLTGPAGQKAHVLSVSCGVFGDRFREIAARFGAEIVGVDIPLGEGVTPEIVQSALAQNPGTEALLLTQNETSTGVLNPIREIAAALPAENRPLVLVDGVSSVGAMPCYPQEWGVDGLATASQKGLRTPPGLGFVWLSERAWQAAAGRKCPSYYFDLTMQKKHLESAPEKPENPYTPPISLYFALDAALTDILADKCHFERRQRAACALAAGLEALGFELLVKDEKFRSPGVTAFSPLDGDVQSIVKELRAIGIEPSGGQGALKGKILRLAHYHDFDWPEIALTLGSLYAAMGEAREQAGDFIGAAYKKYAF